MKTKNMVLTLLCVLSTVFLSAQQESQYSQYMYNTMSINPAYAGNRGVMSISALHRSQWVGLDGAPETQTLNIHSPVGESGRVGLGFSVIHDNIGPTSETQFDAVFSYTIPTSENARLSFGLQAGGHLLNVDFTKLNIYTDGDPGFQNNIDNQFSPNFGFGIYYHHSDRWYLGMSIPNILETKHFDRSSLSSVTERFHIYTIGGYVFDLSRSTKFKPAFLLKGVKGAPIALDLSASFMFHDKFSLGAAYRMDVAWSALAGFQLSDQIMIGFAYDKDTTELGNTSFNDGSYEVFMRFELFKNKGQLISPRFF
ncbi:PorP/SprF family type IX secretion system membrane protein [Winogradskyella tangerina]|uniref:PorP/SprF family type IX secretion system membrane protein n=1 Tax=Winogradskyella tangerina TaxID=2023240 RepID=UPI000DBE00E1|nr:type IX secretion system membrane protein PorP/SprF [Winogradskyella tangerina]